MPTEKNLTKLIPRIYKWNTENLMLFTFIKAQQQIFPAMTIDQAISNFLRFTKITYDEWDLDSIKSTYTRLQNEFYGKNGETSQKDKCDN
jgi:hypothetical protein